MNAELSRLMMKAKEVFAQKEALETMIYEQRLNIHAHEYRLQELGSKMDLKKIRRWNRGRRLGARFAFIGFFFIAALVIILFAGLTAADGFSGGLDISLAVVAVTGLPPVLAATLLLSAYYRSKKGLAAAAELAKGEYDAYYENTAKPEMEECRLRIDELNAQLSAVMSSGAACFELLPREYHNVASAEYIALQFEQGDADNIEDAVKRCRKAGVNREYHRKNKERRNALSSVYKDPTVDYDNTLFGDILDGFMGLFIR